MIVECENGTKAVILCKDAPGAYPIKGYSISDSYYTHGLTVAWSSTGRVLSFHGTSLDIKVEDLEKVQGNDINNFSFVTKTKCGKEVLILCVDAPSSNKAGCIRGYIRSKCKLNGMMTSWDIDGYGEYTLKNVKSVLDAFDVMKTRTDDFLKEFRTPEHMVKTHAAFARGEPIEVYNPTLKNWSIEPNPKFNWDDVAYRSYLEFWVPKKGEIVLARVSEELDNWILSFYGELSNDFHSVYQGPNNLYVLLVGQVKPLGYNNER